ncbi:MAG: type I methionyl aminopeptidase [Hydrogenothermaceae bacterium]|nr:type I methionyl aminopeptidase [Hydrogenothermaceae bacterium]
MIELKTKGDIEKLKVANKIVAEILEIVKDEIRPGVSAKHLDDIAREEAYKRGVRPSFLGLYGFPASLCVSINEEVVHGIPTENKIIKEGDVVSIDFGIEYEGWYGDAALTVAVGDASDRKKRLIEGVEKSLYEGINVCVPGNTLKDVARAIEKVLADYRLTPVCDYGGHGIGRKPHEEPHVTNCIGNAENIEIVEGMVLAIEPMAYLGKGKIRKLKDGWTVVTSDKTHAAHFEHTVAIYGGKVEILSKVD